MRESFLQFLFSSSIDWVSRGVLFAVAIVACIVYYRPMADRRRIFLRFAFGVAVFRLLFAGVRTALQYYAWMRTELTRFFLPPHQSVAVLLHYSWTHFWLNAIVSIGAALLFFAVLRALRAHNPRYFAEGEADLGLLLALVVGWPHVVVFVPAVFLSVVVISLIRGIFLREAYTVLGLPFFIGYAIALVSTGYIIAALSLTSIII